MQEKTREPGGGRLNRSQTVTVRLDPKLNYLCELAARVQRRTKSSFIEKVIDDAIVRIKLDQRAYGSQSPSIGECSDKLWHVRPHERLIELAFLAPHLMTMEEQEIWAVICEHGYFWSGEWNNSGGEQVWTWEVENHSLYRERVGECWDRIVAVAEGREDAKEALPEYPRRRNAATTD